jgi:beta-N-acetylhexosaminidase
MRDEAEYKGASEAGSLGARRCRDAEGVNVERLATRCLLPGFEGLEPPAWLLEEIDRGLGGVVLFGRNVQDAEQLAGLTAALGRDVIVAIDEEGGDVTRLEARTGSSYPGNLALGAVDEPELTERVAAAIGAELRAVGVNLDLAPVADVNTNPLNPVIGVRSFGSDPELVARHVAAFVRGLQSMGVAACAKHFPGHGDTHQDSHLELPVVAGPIDAALVPFRAAIEAGVQGIMSAHIVVPALDELPATLSAAHLGGLLRDQLGFDGLIVTDALEMRAISAHIGVEEGAVRSLVAGADALCLGHDLGAEAVASVRAAILAAVHKGQLTEERLAETAARVDRVIAWTAAADNGRQPARETGLAAARLAVRAEGSVALQRPALVVDLVPEPAIAAGPMHHGLGELLPHAETLRIEESDTFSIPEGERQVVLVVHDAHRHAWQRAIAKTLLDRTSDAVVIEVGTPEWRPRARGYIATYGAGRANLLAAAELLTR